MLFHMLVFMSLIKIRFKKKKKDHHLQNVCFDCDDIILRVDFVVLLLLAQNRPRNRPGP